MCSHSFKIEQRFRLQQEYSQIFRQLNNTLVIVLVEWHIIVDFPYLVKTAEYLLATLISVIVVRSILQEWEYMRFKYAVVQLATPCLKCVWRSRAKFALPV